MHLWGIDLGGTKIEGVVLESRSNPRPLARLRIPTEAHLGYEHICGQVKKMVDMLRAETGLEPHHVGIGHPGTLDRIIGAMKNANTTCLNGMPFDRDLEKLLGVPVRLANDANCFAVAEALLGGAPEALPGAEVVFGVILGTGVGGGWVVHDKVINGRQGLGGEWGHNFLDESGGPCYCGKTGCVETVISGPALERFYAQTTGNSPGRICVPKTPSSNVASILVIKLFVRKEAPKLIPFQVACISNFAMWLKRYFSMLEELSEKVAR